MTCIGSSGLIHSTWWSPWGPPLASDKPWPPSTLMIRPRSGLNSRSGLVGSTIRLAKYNGRHTIIWLLSRASQVWPPSSERYSAESVDSINAYTIFGSDGAIASAIRPYGFSGRPALAPGVNSVQCAPPSREWNRPLPDGASADSPPERNSQPLRRKSHKLANSESGCFGSIATEAQPVDRFVPARTSDQCLPLSVVLYRPRSGESLHSLPGTQA